MGNVAVFASAEQTVTAAKKLAAELRLDYTEQAANYDYLVTVSPNYIGLQKGNEKKFAPFYIDFLSPALLYRVKQATLRKEALARAIGTSPSKRPYLVDATAGLGRDSFILAALGFEVTMLERSLIIYTLLRDALLRAAASELAPIIARMHLIHADAVAWLKEAAHQPDIVYLDPMFPARQKSASVKKEMVILQDLLGKTPQTDELFKAALTCAANRVVVKRPRLAPNISADKAPAYTIPGKSSRFDIYLA